MGVLLAGGIWVLIGGVLLFFTLDGPLRNEICAFLTPLGAAMILLPIIVEWIGDRLRINRMGSICRTKTFDEDWNALPSKLWKSEVIDYRDANGSSQQNQLQAVHIRAANEAFGASGTVVNLVLGAILTPMEGAYGNQEGHTGSASGRA